ncbi:glycosyltransferase family 1 protein [bacterium]|nr:glycosyltransferase family 1 protein [bacterium]
MFQKFLCLVGRHWYNDILLRQFQAHGLNAHTCSLPAPLSDSPPLDSSLLYDLPRDDTTPPDAVLVDDMFWNACLRKFGAPAIRSLVRDLSRGGAVPVVALDHGDTLQSKFRSSDVGEFDLILKAHGLPRDRDLMNWEVGVRWGLNRREKIRKISNPEWRYSPRQLDKFRLSFDLGMAYCGRRIHPLPGFFEPFDVFFAGAFNSLNRLEGLKLCKRRFRTLGRLVRLAADHPIVGLEEGGARRETLVWDEIYARRRKLSAEWIDRHPELFGRPISSGRFTAMAVLSKIMPAFSGIGELGPRHYQALSFGKLLLCEDLSHVETHFPFRDGETCVHVSDRLEDLETRVRELLTDAARRKRIAREGFERFRECYGDGSKMFRDCFLRHLEDAAHVSITAAAGY